MDLPPAPLKGGGILSCPPGGRKDHVPPLLIVVINQTEPARARRLDRPADLSTKIDSFKGPITSAAVTTTLGTLPVPLIVRPSVLAVTFNLFRILLVNFRKFVASIILSV
jgi:hypothetical protein